MPIAVNGIAKSLTCLANQQSWNANSKNWNAERVECSAKTVVLKRTSPQLLA
jgi:hypothetical protein